MVIKHRDCQPAEGAQLIPGQLWRQEGLGSGTSSFQKAVPRDGVEERGL